MGNIGKHRLISKLCLTRSDCGPRTNQSSVSYDKMLDEKKQWRSMSGQFCPFVPHPALWQSSRSDTHPTCILCRLLSADFHHCRASQKSIGSFEIQQWSSIWPKCERDDHASLNPLPELGNHGLHHLTAIELSSVIGPLKIQVLSWRQGFYGAGPLSRLPQGWHLQ